MKKSENENSITVNLSQINKKKIYIYITDDRLTHSSEI